MVNRISHYVISTCIVALFFTGCCKPLQVSLHPQETSRWCWAASGQMIMDYLGHDVLQCAQANNRFNRTDCCTIDLCPLPTEPVPPEPQPCNCVCGGWPEFNKYGFTFSKTSDAALSWEQVKEEICEKRPFAFTWHWPGENGGGHMMVAKGYFSLDGNNYMIILDPWAPCVGDERIITYDYYVQSPGHHTHWDDYYDIKYTGGQ